MDMKPTEKQLRFIADIEEFVGEQFRGTTKKEATEYISRNIERYKLLTMDNYILENGYF